MSERMSENLSQSEQEAFKELREASMPSSMEDQVVNRLEEENLFNHQKEVIMKNWIYSVAASIAFFVVGYYVASSQVTTAAVQTSDSDLTKYVILLYEDASFTGENSALVGEYMAWGQDWGKKGKMAGGAKLALNTEWFGEGFEQSSSPGKLTGYFVIQVENYDEALAITKTHPHTNYGGRIELREIEKL